MLSLPLYSGSSPSAIWTTFYFSSKLQVDRIEQVRRILWLLYEAEVKHKPRKCKLFAETINYLGHVIRLGRVVLAEPRTEVMAKIEHHTVQVQLRSFLELYSVLMRFVSSFAHLSALVIKTLKKDQPKQRCSLD